MPAISTAMVTPASAFFRAGLPDGMAGEALAGEDMENSGFGKGQYVQKRKMDRSAGRHQSHRNLGQSGTVTTTDRTDQAHLGGERAGLQIDRLAALGQHRRVGIEQRQVGAQARAVA